MGGVLDVGIQGFLGNLEAPRPDSDTETAPVGGVVERWWAKFGERQVGAAELYGLGEYLDLGARQAADSCVDAGVSLK